MHLRVLNPLRVLAWARDLSRRVALLEQSLGRPLAPLHDDGANANSLDYFLTDAPNPRNAFDLFKQEWSSNIPGFGYGHAPLFNDDRVQWFMDQCGGVLGKSVMELGPLEGGHTKMLADAGGNVTAIESNSRAFLKCLIAQSVFKFKANILLGDFRPFLRTCQERYDVLIACGVLYHMTDPVQLLQDAARVSRTVCLWTHYYDADAIKDNDAVRRRFNPSPVTKSVNGRTVSMHEQRYLEATKWKGFCGGTSETSFWLTRESLLGALEALGATVTIRDEDRSHPSGPCITLVAKC